MHNALVAACFLLLILIPCFVAMKSSAKEDKTGSSGEHAVARPTAARGHSPSRIRAAADAMAARKAAKLAAEQGSVTLGTGERPSRIRMAAAAVFSRPAEDDVTASLTDRPSRIRMVAAVLTQRKPKGPVPMAEGDPGTRKQSIRDLRAKHAQRAERG